MSTKFQLLLLLFSVACLLSACSGEPAEDKCLLKVNGFSLTECDFNRLLKSEMEADRGFDMAGDIKVEFLNDLIRKQLMIQEAKKLKLDQREIFRQAIERYWESTLIRDLLNVKGQQLRQETAVTPQEVQDYYNTNKAHFADQSFEELAPRIREQIEKERVAGMLQQWIDGLVDAANIEISDKTLEKKLATVKEGN